MLHRCVIIVPTKKLNPEQMTVKKKNKNNSIVHVKFYLEHSAKYVIRWQICYWRVMAR